MGDLAGKRSLSPGRNRASAAPPQSGCSRPVATSIFTITATKAAPKRWWRWPIHWGKGRLRLRRSHRYRRNAALHLGRRRVLGGIDILVNNVGGIVGRKWLGEIDRAFWQTVIDVNMTTMLNVTQSALPFLKAANGASIVNLASQAGRAGGHSGSLVYSATKGAVLTWTRSLAAELGEYGIRVNAVAPGLILGTRFHNRHTTQESAEETVRAIPLGRAGTPDDVARAIAFLAAEYDGFISGATLDINGGIYRM